MRRWAWLLTAILAPTALLAPGAIPSAVAHPGHGAGDGDSLVHHVVEPEHNGWLILALIGSGIFGTRVLIKKQEEKEARAPVRRRAE